MAPSGRSLKRTSGTGKAPKRKTGPPSKRRNVSTRNNDEASSDRVGLARQIALSNDSSEDDEDYEEEGEDTETQLSMDLLGTSQGEARISTSVVGVVRGNEERSTLESAASRNMGGTSTSTSHPSIDNTSLQHDPYSFTAMKSKVITFGQRPNLDGFARYVYFLEKNLAAEKEKVASLEKRFSRDKQREEADLLSQKVQDAVNKCVPDIFPHWKYPSLERVCNCFWYRITFIQLFNIFSV